MKAREEEDQREQNKLLARVKQLEYNLEDYSEKISYWRGKYGEAEDAYERERQLRQSAEMEMEMLRKGLTNGTDAVDLPRRRPVQNEYTEESAPGVQEATTATELMGMGCGNCSAETKCQCIEEAFEIANVAAERDAPTFKRPHSPQSRSDNKRRQISEPDTTSEIDFTAQFSRQAPTLTASVSTSSSIAATALPDPCGFCSDGTTCLCAELAKERPDRALRPPESNLPTPPESATTNNSTLDPCINGPGTCTQCRSNPTSTLFCKSLAATRSRNPKVPILATKDSTNQEPTEGSTINCADAFTVLSRHPGFDQATSELSTWIPHLSTVPSATTAFDVEAASVMSVLKLFDRRFDTTSKNDPSSPKEASSNLSDHILTLGSRGTVGVSALDESIKTRDRGTGQKTGKSDRKDRNRIAYSPDN